MVICAILYNNAQRIVSDYPYTQEMIDENVQPYPGSIFEWGKGQPGCNLITVSPRQLVMTLLPRTKAKFTRRGLLVSGLRYDSKAGNFTEDYLRGGEVVAAYNPESADTVYLLREGEFIEFNLIESRFSGRSFGEIKKMLSEQKNLENDAVHENLQGRVDLASHVERIISGTAQDRDVNLKGIRSTKSRAKRERHKDFVEEVDKGE